MKNNQEYVVQKRGPSALRCSLVAAVMGAVTSVAVTAQEAPEALEEVVVTGIRGSLANALDQKRNADNLIEVIQAEDIGKLPDQNLAEVLENITGVQITRTAGVGTGVQIRGTNANRVEINGVSTVGSGSGRSGIDFEDVSAAIIASVEVVKSPDAKTIEGSVGGTVNLKTIRPLELEERLGSIRIQGEESSLTTDGIQPRISGAFGDSWETEAGEFGFMISGSKTEQESVSFRPRVDRDGGLVENLDANVVRGGNAQDVSARPAAQAFDFLGIQFLNQELENYEYDTTNLAATFEWAPNDSVTVFFDAVINEQERRQDSSRIQGSGVSSVLDVNVPDSFETICYGAVGGQDIGCIQAALSGTVQPNIAKDDDDPNLRYSSDTGARVTDSEIFRLGADWVQGAWSGRVEVSSSSSDTANPNLSTTLNFINPNALTPLDNLDVNGDITTSTSNDNSVPFIYDLSGGNLSFGVDFASPFAPTQAELLDPNNVVLDDARIGRNTTENSEDAFRADFSYEISDSGWTSIDFGFRRNETTSTFNSINDRIGGFSKMVDSPNGSLFADLLVAGPTNYNAGNGLAFTDVLAIDPDRAFSDAAGVIDALDQAVAANCAVYADTTGKDCSTIGRVSLAPSTTAFFDIEETTDAIYFQANFDMGMVRGNVGVRYVDTEVDSLGNTIVDGDVSQVVTTGSYDFFLPRLNIVATPTEDLTLRFGYGYDIRRPNFSDLSTSVNFPTGPNTPVEIGNPALKPEEVKSLDLSAEWYFAPAAVASVGYFHKERSNLFVAGFEDRAIDANGFADLTAPCEGGGIFNPAADRNVLAPEDQAGNGLCVPRETKLNDSAKTTQKGIELAFQYDLSSFEDDLGWASGFGVIANYTIQEFDTRGPNPATNTSATRGTDIFNAINGVYDDSAFVRYSEEQGLLDFSENAYNFTVFYEKYGISARMRYTWREAFRTDDTAGGASRNSTLGFPVVTEDRGQVNASINYDVNDQLNVGLEAVNLTESEIKQYCVNDGAQLCFQGVPDRRITLGASYRF